MLNNKIVDASVLVDVAQIGWVNHVKSLFYAFVWFLYVLCMFIFILVALCLV